jgi:hypothetical protein
MREPDPLYHNIFDTYAEAMEEYMNLPEEIQQIIIPPRQSHDCWIFDKYTQE